MYRLKELTFEGVARRVAMQDENGPCPLLAVANALSLRGVLHMPPLEQGSVSGVVLAQQLANMALERNVEDANTQGIVDGLLDLLPQLEDGLDVNVRFDAVDAFEYTKELELFDVFGLALVHGWLCDPESDAGQVLLKHGWSYNTAVSHLLSEDGTLSPAEAEALRRFLDASSGQLTVYGLHQLYASRPDSSTSILFRNNHFGVLYMHQGRAFILATDDSFTNDPFIVWEELAQIDGDTRYVDSTFQDQATARQTAEDHAFASQMQRRARVDPPVDTKCECMIQ